MYAMEFEDVVEKYLFDNPKGTMAGMYTNDLPGARAIIYTILIKEVYSNYSKYSEEDINNMNAIKDKILEESSDISVLHNGIDVLRDSYHKR